MGDTQCNEATLSNPRPAPISVRAFAKIVGVSHTAIRKAIEKGRLKACLAVGEDGSPRIADVELGKREWGEADRSKAPTYVKERASTRARAPAPAAAVEGAASAPPGEMEPPASLSLTDESAREKFWKANLAELDFRKRSAELVEAKEMGDRIIDVFTRVRTRLLAIPTRAKQQLPHLNVTDVATVDELVREALEGLAIDLEQEEAREVSAG